MARQTGQQRQESRQQRRQQKPARVVRKGQRAILNGKRVIADGKGNWMPESHYDRYSKNFKKGKPVGTYTVGRDRSQPAATAADIARSDAQYRASGGKTGVGRRASTTSSRSGSKGAKSTTRGRSGSTAADIARSDAQYKASGGRTGVGRRNVTPAPKPASKAAPKAAPKAAAKPKKPTAEEGRMIWARKYSADKYKDQAIGKEARRYLAKQQKTKTLRKEAQATYNRGSA